MAESADKPAFKWNAQREEAAMLCAEGKLNDTEIAQQLGIARYTLYKWRQEKEFADRIQSRINALATLAMAKGLRDREGRLERLEKLVEKMERVIDERGAEMAAECAGGKSGLLARDMKGVDRVYKFDRGLVAEMRDTLKHIAQELGQWTEKKELTGKDGGPLTVKSIQAMSDEELAAIVNE